VDVVLAVSAQEVIDHEMVHHIDAEPEAPEEHLETRSEPEDEVGLGRPVPGHSARSDEEERSDVAAREVVGETPSMQRR